MTLTELGAHFVATGCATAPGTDLFYGAMPDAPDACAALLESGGSPPAQSLGGVTEYEVVRLQLLVRGANYVDARQVIEDYYRAVLDLRNQWLSGTFYLNGEPHQPPYYLDRDDRDRPMFGFNFEVWKRLS